MKSRIILLCVVLVVAIAATVDAKEKKQQSDCTKHAGYVDFNALQLFPGQDPKIEVHLRQQMLNLLRKFLQEEDPELYDIFGKLCLVRVQVFDVSREMAVKFDAESAKTVKELDKKGWERVVMVNDDEEQVFVYLKPSEDYEFIQGIVVLAMEDYEAVFVNIVGDIAPEDINRLGGHFGVEELDSIRYEINKGN